MNITSNINLDSTVWITAPTKTGGTIQPNIVSPGIDVFPSLPDVSIYPQNPGDGYGYGNGTSFPNSFPNSAPWSPPPLDLTLIVPLRDIQTLYKVGSLLYTYMASAKVSIGIMEKPKCPGCLSTDASPLTLETALLTITGYKELTFLHECGIECFLPKVTCMNCFEVYFSTLMIK